MEKFVRPRPTFPKRAVITSGMPYGNKSLHIGHMAMTLRADTFARFMRDRIGSENVIFVSGTDCYGTTASETFRKLKNEGKIDDNSIEEFVERNHKDQKDIFEKYQLSFNLFGASAIGKSKAFHQEESEKVIKGLYKAGAISKQSSLQFYDEKLGQFLNGRQVLGKCPFENCQSEKGYADECDLGHQYLPQDLIDPVSTLTGLTPTLKEIENWYFDLDECTDILTKWLDDISRKSDTSSFMIKEIREFLKKPEIYVKKEYKDTVLALNLPNYEIIGKDTAPSFTMVFDKLRDREAACKVLSSNGVRYRTGKTLTPFRLTCDLSWGVPCPVIDGLQGRTFYVWPESLWAPISFTKTYLNSIGKDDEEWKKFWCSKDAQVYQFIGEDNIYFYGPAQQAMFIKMQGKDCTYPAPDGKLQTTTIVPIKHLLYLSKKASSSGAIKPPTGRELLDYYTPEQFRMHILGMNLGNNNISLNPKPFDSEAKPEDADPVLKEGNLLTNVYNRILRTVFYTIQNKFGGRLPEGKVSEEVKAECEKAILDYERLMYDKKFHQVVNVVDVFVRNINKYYVKNVNDCDEQQKLANLVYNTLQYIVTANVLLHPMAPTGTEKVRDYLGLSDKAFSWNYIFDDLENLLDKSRERKIIAIKEKEDFFKKHQSQLDELAALAGKN